MVIIEKSITNDELKEFSDNFFEGMVKAVVDIEKELLAIDAELHADLEAFLLNQGSLQNNLWGINLYPDFEDADFVEFDSMINLRPSDNNRSFYVEDENIRKRVIEIVNKRIKR